MAITNRERQVFTQNEFKGIFYTNDPASLGEGFLADCRDFFVSTSENELLARPGWVNLAQSGMPYGVDWMTIYRTSARNEIVCANRTTNLMYTQNQNNLVTTYNSVDFGSTEMAVQYNDNLYILNFAGGIYKYDGNTVSTVASTPNLSYGVIFKDRLFGNHPRGSNPSRVYYCDSTDLTSWPGANFFDVNPGDGAFVECSYPINDRLLVFKNNKTYALIFSSADPAYWTLQLISPTVGCISRHSVKDINGLVYFASNDGIYRTDGYTLEPVSRAINSTVFPTSTSAPVGSSPRYLTAGKWKDFYVFSTPYNNTDKLIFLFNTKFNSWWSFTTPTETLWSYFTEYENPVWGSESVPVTTLIACPHRDYQLTFSYFGGLADGGSVKYTYTERDVDNNITFVEPQLRTKSFDFGNPFNYNKVQDIYVVASGVQNNALRVIPIPDDSAYSDRVFYFLKDQVAQSFRSPVMAWCNSFGVSVEMDITYAPAVLEFQPALYQIGIGYKPGRELIHSGTR